MIPIHYDLIFLIQMQIQLLHLPDAILLRRVCIIIGLRGKLYPLNRRLRNRFMRTMAIFAVQILCEYHIRLVFSDNAGHIRIYALLCATPCCKCFAAFSNALVRKSANLRIIFHTACPQCI